VVKKLKKTRKKIEKIDGNKENIKRVIKKGIIKRSEPEKNK
tara:strand:- start:443 stop:565 length:123 start_codon:yes stop_codon:yes gene_type:complete